MPSMSAVKTLSSGLSHVYRLKSRARSTWGSKVEVLPHVDVAELLRTGSQAMVSEALSTTRRVGAPESSPVCYPCTAVGGLVPIAAAEHSLGIRVPTLG